MNRVLILLMLLFAFILGKTQVNKYGYPFYRYYSMKEYNGSEQNWAIVRDNRGFLYVGNNDKGVLQYDGKYWKNIPAANKSIIRSLASDNKGNVFVGAVGEFGHLQPNQQGELTYVSLVPLLDTSLQNAFSDVWKTWATDSVVYYCTNSHIFIYNYETIRILNLPKFSNFSFVLNNDIFIGHYNKGLLSFKGDSIETINSSHFSGKNIFFVEKINDSLNIIGTVDNGLYTINTNNNQVQVPMCDATNAYLKKNRLYHAQIEPEGSFFATLNGGVIATQEKQLKEIYNSQVGLPSDERVFYVYSDQDGNNPLWGALNNGLIRIDQHLPFRIMDGRNGLNGYVTDVLRFNENLYVATSSGLYELSYSKTQPVLQSVLEHATWSLTEYQYPRSNNKVLMIATARGVFELNQQGQISKIEDRVTNIQKGLSYYVFDILAPKTRYSDYLLLGTRVGFYALKTDGHKWKEVLNPENTGIQNEIRTLTFQNGRIWLSTMYEGIVSFDINQSDSITKYNQEKGLEIIIDNRLALYNDNIYALSASGLLKYDEQTDSFIHDSVLGKLATKNKMGVSELVKSNDFFYMNLYNDNSHRIRRVDLNGNWSQYDTAIFNRLPNVQSDVIYPDGDITWFGSSEGLISFQNKAPEIKMDNKFYCYVRQVTMGHDSIIFGGAGIKNGIITSQKSQDKDDIFNYGSNDVSFQYAAPYFDGESKLMYSYMLEGYDEEWSEWTHKTEKEYTNLPAGDYKFFVKAKNVYGLESKASVFEMGVETEAGSYAFKILPPWYLSVWAIIGYVIALIFIVYLLVQWRTRKLKKEKEHLEKIVKERTAEIVEKKEEIEKQRDEIADKNQSITDSIQYASRIQQALLPSKEMLDKAVPDHFVLFKPRDIVSGDYYWMTQIKQKTILVAADCTGHGVPGAFMSMLGMSFFNEIVNKNFITDAGEILNHLRAHVIEALKQEGDNVQAKDGMDLALYVIDNETKTINFAGANNPLYIIREQTEEEKQAIANNDETKLPKRPVFNDTHILDEVKADKMPIGIHIKSDPFKTKKVEIDTDMQLYTFSDGYVDQFGGPKRRKFMSKAFKKLLMEIHKKPMEEQKEILDKQIMEWIKEGNEIQVDDIVVLGVKIKKS